ncbi:MULTISPECIES: response regulator [Methylobacterium]|uniref:response regulator n=1 Tax=Methylobacterium TaxID=407 RepID=UPI0008E125D9|nr:MULTISPECIES: response regulator [Methylobacterium]MBZ6414720.1 response regulator [Methylobacterium sp.]MBK3398850.1 response regulator [Methylobacterium ajmalii]MBK3409817.1 response regulator [Methylobacterium ajmalii]MBK3423053.1 response regulator [Methylobacterium ajmalii]SFE31751.1 Response regulator receiver domain-containing protein [Methylobacterium sp. yr596]
MARVLIVDDEFGIAELLDAVLSDDGHAVATAANGRQGLARVAADPPDLIFLDFMMPVMDGPAMLAALAGDPGTRGIPVVLMSSMPEETVRERAGGHAAFLRKPFRLKQVRNLVAALAPRDE